jgi:hypothetical protein
MSDTEPVRGELLQEHDIIRVLQQQHQRILDLFTGVRAATGEARIDALRELRALFVVHETSEQLLLHPRAVDLIGSGFVDELKVIEDELSNEIANLETIPPEHGQFEPNLDTIEGAVLDHFHVEETQEFPVIVEQCPVDERLVLGKRLVGAAKLLPTRPHPAVDGRTATVLTAPLASLVDRTRDAIQRESS